MADLAIVALWIVAFLTGFGCGVFALLVWQAAQDEDDARARRFAASRDGLARAQRRVVR